MKINADQDDYGTENR